MCIYVSKMNGALMSLHIWKGFITNILGRDSPSRISGMHILICTHIIRVTQWILLNPVDPEA